MASYPHNMLQKQCRNKDFQDLLVCYSNLGILFTTGLDLCDKHRKKKRDSKQQSYSRNGSMPVLQFRALMHHRISFSHEGLLHFNTLFFLSLLPIFLCEGKRREGKSLMNSKAKVMFFLFQKGQKKVRLRSKLNESFLVFYLNKI